jgi:hypothetical protein
MPMDRSGQKGKAVLAALNRAQRIVLRSPATFAIFPRFCESFDAYAVHT